MPTKQELEQYYLVNEPRFIKEWSESLRFKSISTDPAYDSECRSCAEWYRDHLVKLGLDAKILETRSEVSAQADKAGPESERGQPLVYAERIINPTRPTVLFYGHYDVQPVDPIDQWSSAPFEPTLRGDRLYARGAMDNKGQVFYLLKALEYLLARNEINCNLRILLEGEEESGSAGLSRSIPRYAELLKGDILMVCDTGCVPSGNPTIIAGLRGIVDFTISLKGSTYDLHSGVHGGVAPNPAMEMARLLSCLHNPDGSIAIPGYYTKVLEPSHEEQRLANQFTITNEQYRALSGAEPVAGEQAYSIAVRSGFRPTIELNGIHSGYGGPGGKTIIPAVAQAKISARLVHDQDPNEALSKILEFLKSKTVRGLQLSVDESRIGGRALKVDPNAKLVKQAQSVLEDLFEMPAIFRWEGGSVPILSELQIAMSEGGRAVTPVLVGFGLMEDNMHAPNESFSLNQLKRGFLYATKYLSTL